MGFAGTGIELRRGDGGGPETFTLIGEVRSISGPDGQATEIDRSHFQSTAKEWVMGLPDEGSLTIDGNFVGSDAQQQGLHSDRANRVKRNFELELTDMPSGGANNTQFDFSGYVMRFTLTGNVDGGLDFSVTLRITGPVTPTWAS